MAGIELKIGDKLSDGQFDEFVADYVDDLTLLFEYAELEILALMEQAINEDWSMDILIDKIEAIF